jgi:predicted metalloprotease
MRFRPTRRKTNWSRLVLAALAAFALAGLTACGSSGPSADSSGAPDYGASAQAAPSGGLGSAPAPENSGGSPGDDSGGQIVDLQNGNVVPSAPANNCPNSPSLRDCFTENTMASYYEIVLPEIDQFFDNTWSQMPLPAHVYFIPDGASTTEQCGEGNGSNATADETSYNYCPVDDNVYLGAQMAYQTLYNQDGDIAPAIALAHEFGHDVQEHVGVPDPQTDAQTLVHEQQADCVSGAWLGYAEQQGWVEQEDVPSLTRYIPSIADAENNPDPTHGDVQVRAAAVQKGLDGGIHACNSYYPDYPLIN